MELAMGDTREPGRTECLEKCRDALLRENEIIANLIENSNRREISDCREDKNINQFPTCHHG
jgi:hypothetical protein